MSLGEGSGVGLICFACSLMPWLGMPAGRIVYNYLFGAEMLLMHVELC